MTNENELSCTNCGKPLKMERITLKSLFYDTVNVIFNLEKGFLYTIKMLFINPGFVIETYLKSNERYRFYNPFRYAFILASASVFLFVVFNLYEKAVTSVAQNLDASEIEEIRQIENYANIISLLIIPFISIGSALFYRSLNYAEHMVANFYTFGQSTLIGFVFIPLYIFVPEALLHQQNISTLTLLVYGTYFYKGVFKENLGKSFLKFLAILLIGFIAFALLAAVFALVYKMVSA